MGDARGESISWLNLGRLHVEKGALDEASTALERARDMAERAAAPRSALMAIWRAAMVEIDRGDLPHAEALLTEARARNQDDPDQRTEAAMGVTMGNLRLAAGDVAAASLAHDDALRLQRKLGGPLYVGNAAQHASLSALASQDHALAHALATEAIALYAEAKSAQKGCIACVIAAASAPSPALAAPWLDRAASLVQDEVEAAAVDLGRQLVAHPCAIAVSPHVAALAQRSAVIRALASRLAWYLVPNRDTADSG